MTDWHSAMAFVCVVMLCLLMALPAMGREP